MGHVFAKALVVGIALWSNIAFAASPGLLLFGVDKPKNIYVGQMADNNRDKTGTGMSLSKNGNLYVGDFHNGKFSGYGMMIVGENGKIANVPGTAFYVGDWIDNKKEGVGTCYGANGDIIYEGKFVDDEPVGAYPSVRVNQLRYFSDLETENGEYYIGEVTGGKPDGFGLFVLPDGGRSIGRVKQGRRYGVSLILAGKDWMLVKWDPRMNGYEQISSTADFNARREQYRVAQAKINQELRESLLDLAQKGMQLAADYQAMRNKPVGNGEYYEDEGVATGGGGSGKSSKNSAGKKSKKADCGTAWMSDSRVYSDYESQLVANGSRTATDDSQRKNIRNKMRSIRTKWEARGCTITKSPYE